MGLTRDRDPRPFGAGSSLALLALAAVAAVLWIRPPGPRPADAPPGEFSALRAWPDLERIAAEPRPTGSLALDRVRSLLSSRLGELGLEVRLQRSEVQVRVGAEEEAFELVNVLGRRRGDGTGGTVLFDVHHDSVARAPGAGDNGAAVAATLEALRALQGEAAGRNDLVVLFADGEERGLLGARAFAERHPWFEGVRAVVNLDARGAAGPSILFQVGPRSGGLVRTHALRSAHAFGSSLAPSVYARLPRDTDFSIYLQRGLPGLNFAFVGGGQAYHDPRDRPAALDPGSLQHHGEALLGLMRALAHADLDRLLEEPDVEFLPVPGVGLVTLPAAPVALAARGAGLVVLAALGLALRSGRLRAGALLAALARLLVTLGLALALALGAAELARLALEPLLDRFLAGEGEAALRGASALATEAATVGLWFVLLGGALLAWPGPGRELGAAALLVQALLTGLLPDLAPGASHVGLLPLVGLALALAARPLAAPLGLLASLPALGVLLPVAALLAQVGSTEPGRETILAGASLALVLVPLAPLLDRLRRDLGPRAALAWTGLGLVVLVLRGVLDARGL